MEFSRRIEPHQPADLIHNVEPPADVQRRRCNHVALLYEGELGGAPADVNIEKALVMIVGRLGCTRPISREHRLHMVSGGGRYEVAALLRGKAGDRLGILSPQRLTREDHDAGIDFLRLYAGSFIGAIDYPAECDFIDAHVAGIGCERHRRLKQRLTRDHVIAAREILPVAAQIDAGEDDLGPR